MNAVLKAIEERFSCRAFTGRMPEEEEIRAIARAATQAPSALNRQPWQVVVLREKELMDELETEGMRVLAAQPDRTLYERIQSRGGRLFYNAPCIIYLPMDATGENLARSALDCGIVSQTVVLAAEGLGLASCICGLARLSFSEEKGADFKKRLNFAEGYEFGAAVLIGEAVERVAPHVPDEGKMVFIG